MPKFTKVKATIEFTIKGDHKDDAEYIKGCILTYQAKQPPRLKNQMGFSLIESEVVETEKKTDLKARVYNLVRKEILAAWDDPEATLTFHRSGGEIRIYRSGLPATQTAHFRGNKFTLMQISNSIKAHAVIDISDPDFGKRIVEAIHSNQAGG